MPTIPHHALLAAVFATSVTVVVHAWPTDDNDEPEAGGAGETPPRTARMNTRKPPAGTTWPQTGPWEYEPDEGQLARHEGATKTCSPSATLGIRPLENAVITYLATSEHDIKWLVEHAIPRVWHFFLRTWAYDVLVFVPSKAMRTYDPESFGGAPDPEDVKRRCHSRTGLPDLYNLRVIEFDVSFPDTILNDPNWKEPTRSNQCARKFWTGYKHMNHFFTHLMYEHPALAKYNYYLRLDTDLGFTAKVPWDPFCLMKELGRNFIWESRRKIASPDCADGLWEWFHDYAKNNSLTAVDKTVWGPLAAHTNYIGYITGGSLDFFRRDDVRKLSHAMNEDGRIYTHRWSDQTYYVLINSLLEEHNAVGDIGIGWPPAVWCHKCKLKTSWQEKCEEAYEHLCFTRQAGSELGDDANGDVPF